MKITVSKDAKYLSEAISELPHNCLFDKGKVGCGGTTLAIESGKPYVIAVPFQRLIENKMEQHDNIIGVYHNSPYYDKHDLRKAIIESDNPIIMVTYDSLGKVMNNIDYSKYNLLIDEYHLLFTQYAFRNKAVHEVLANYAKFKQFCFMTATPIDKEFVLDELKDIPVVTMEWVGVRNISITPVKVLGKSEDALHELIESFLDGKEEGNLYAFVNSISMMKKVYGNERLDESNCNMIFSKNAKNTNLPMGKLPSTKGADTKKINLLTSTVFEGCDIYDEDGRTFVISDASKAHTLTDIATSMQQIAGRIRNSTYLGEISHFYTQSRYTDVTYKEFKDKMEDEIETAVGLVAILNGMTERQREMAIKQQKWDGVYFSKSHDGLKVEFDPNLPKLDMFNYRLLNSVYSCRVDHLRNEYQKNGLTVLDTERRKPKEYELPVNELEGFEKVVKNIQAIQQGREVVISEDFKISQYSEEESIYIETAYKKYPFLKNAIQKLGFDGIDELKYIVTHIKRKLITMLDKGNEVKIAKLLKTRGVAVFNTYTNRELKKIFTDIYKELGIEKTAKGTDINQFFHTKPATRNVNGKRMKALSIISPKFLINE